GRPVPRAEPRIKVDIAFAASDFMLHARSGKYQDANGRPHGQHCQKICKGRRPAIANRSTVPIAQTQMSLKANHERRTSRATATEEQRTSLIYPPFDKVVDIRARPIMNRRNSEPYLVIPAQAGIQGSEFPRLPWTPAFAGGRGRDMGHPMPPAQNRTC